MRLEPGASREGQVNEMGMFNVTEQRFVEQKNYILKRK